MRYTSTSYRQTPPKPKPQPAPRPKRPQQRRQPMTAMGWLETHPDIAALLLEVAVTFQVRIDQMQSHRRSPSLIQARIAFIKRAEPFFSSVDIGRALNRDHTTILHHMGRLGRKDRKWWRRAGANDNG